MRHVNLVHTTHAEKRELPTGTAQKLCSAALAVAATDVAAAAARVVNTWRARALRVGQCPATGTSYIFTAYVVCACVYPYGCSNVLAYSAVYSIMSSVIIFANTRSRYKQAAHTQAVKSTHAAQSAQLRAAHRQQRRMCLWILIYGCCALMYGSFTHWQHNVAL